MRVVVFIFISLLTFQSVGRCAEGESFSQGKKLSAEQGKPLLIEFYREG